MKNRPDYILLGIVLLLIIIGIIILASVSFAPSQNRFGNSFYFLNHQVIFGLLPGLILGFIAYKMKISYFKKLVIPLLIVNLFLLVLVLIPGIGSADWGAARWISVGDFSFQPSEFLKVCFILYLASWLSTRTSSFKENISIKDKKFKRWIKLNRGLNETFVAFLIILGFISFLLISQPDISTLGIICTIALAMYFLAGAPLWHAGFVVLLGGVGLITLIKIAPYRMNRFLVFLNPEQYPMGIGYHLKQSLITVGSGGLNGLGLGLSRQRFGFLPGTMSDSVFAIFSEETGFIGSFLIIALFLFFLIKGFGISRRTKDKFLQFTGFGITFWIVVQAFINIGAMLSIVPLTGIPLPFISYGGSAIVAELIGIGILLNISKHSKV